ncbi:hypothetical protein GW916_00300 [bacterium]|nr:hypothetical protein [bacterium]
MEDLKFLVPILREMLKTNPSLAGAFIGSKKEMRRMLRKEVFYVSIRVMFGLVISGGVIYSLIRLLQEAHFFLISTGNGALNTSLFFGSLIVIGMVTLSLLFRTTSKTEPPPPSQLEQAIEKVALSFCNGIIDGMHKANQEDKFSSQKSAVDDFDEPVGDQFEEASSAKVADDWDVSNGYRSSIP